MYEHYEKYSNNRIATTVQFLTFSELFLHFNIIWNDSNYQCHQYFNNSLQNNKNYRFCKSTTALTIKHITTSMGAFNETPAPTN